MSCHFDTDLGGSQMVVSGDGRSPIELCREVWEEGVPRVIAPQQAPDLVACVGPGGQAAVFPGESDEQCGALGLAPLDVELSPDQLVAIEFEDSFTDRIIDRGCIAVDEFVAIATEELERADLDWDVVVLNEPTAATPCAIAGFDPANGAVNVRLVEDLWPAPDSSPNDSRPSNSQEEP